MINRSVATIGDNEVLRRSGKSSMGSKAGHGGATKATEA